MARNRGFIVVEIVVALSALAGIAVAASASDPLFDRMCVSGTVSSEEAQTGTSRTLAEAQRWVCAEVASAESAENRFVDALRR